MSSKEIQLDELYKLNNENFIRRAFQLLLNREVDENGLLHYLNKINSGKSRTSILNQIMQSNEFSQDKSSIVNSNKLLKLSNILTRPLFGKPLKQYAKPIRVLDKKLNEYIRLKEFSLITETSSSNQLLLINNAISNEIPSTIVHNGAVLNQINKKLIELESANIHNQKMLSKFKKYSTDNSSQDNKIYMNLTTTRHWRSRAVGIIKAERELAKFLYDNVDNVIFFIWSENKNNFYEIPLALVNEFLKDSWMDISKKVMELKEDYFDQKLNLTKNDVLISIGLDWDNNLTKKIYNLKQDSKCKVILACYDLIPILYPEHTVAPEFKQLFQKHFVDMFYTADLVWTISENSKKDLLNFWQKDCNLDISKSPKVEVIILGSDINDDDLQEMNEFEKGQLRHIRSLGKYVMYVSSFESRKNHKILLDIWRDGYQNYGEDFPTLVIVGRHGWGVDELISHMNRMLVTKAGKIIWLNNASDALVSALYNTVDFTVFPSLYEGWGLAATESLQKGKPCIVANNSSLIEATQNLMPGIYPLDYPAWQKTIEKLVFDKSYKATLIKNIENKYKAMTWREFSENFIKFSNKIIQ